MESILPFANFPFFFTATLAFLLMPGPAVLYVVTRSVDQGRKAGLVSVLGLQTGALVHVFAAALGLSAILVTSALAFDVVKYLGAAYLIYLGIRKFMERDKAESAETIKHDTLRRVYSQGIIVSILNPKTALFFFAFLPQFVDSARGYVPLQMFILGVIFVVMALTTDSLYALAAGTVGRFLRGNLRYLRFQRYFSGTVYIGLGLATAFSGSSRK